MAFDGFCIRKIVSEYREFLTDGKISKIIEPASHEIILVVKNNKDSYNIFASANPSVPYTFVTDDKPEAPGIAPNFCMVLRKHIQNGKILRVYQFGNERIIAFDIEHLNEMGDRSVKKLVLELMGKYSNIILLDENDVIIDSIKHVSFVTSSIREVLPGKKYFVPDEITRINPFKNDFCDKDHITRVIGDIFAEVDNPDSGAANILSSKLEGVSKVAVREIMLRAGIDSSLKIKDFDSLKIASLTESFYGFLEDTVKSDKAFLYKNDNGYEEYSTVLYQSLEGFTVETSEYISTSLSKFYKQKKSRTENIQKSGELIRFVKNILDKDNNKTQVWQQDLKNCENKEDLKIKGELLKAYAYSLKQGKSVNVLNYYTNETIDIELDERLTVIENSNKYYKAYNKAKRCEEAVNGLIEKNNEEIEYLEEVMLFLSFAENSSDIEEIKSELAEKGYLKKKSFKNSKNAKLKIKHYLYKDNYHIFVGKNNVQNEEITFKKAVGNDWWFHAKGIPGSHVLIKSDTDNPASEWDMPDDVFELGAALAAYNSKHEGNGKVEVDYTRKKHVKKPADGRKGMVIYHTNYSMVANPDITRFELTVIS